MKTINKGRPQKGWSIETTCTGKGNGKGGCGAKLLVERADFFRTSRSFMDGSTDFYATFQCCECGVWTDVEEYPFSAKDLPTSVEWARKKEKKQ